ncbi:MAG: hypothetical protein PHU25_17160 [Deltaproteobacteria bacterium]|nr:hypothetical protein [Deltaproteobacteria bacterium]
MGLRDRLWDLIETLRVRLGGQDPYQLANLTLPVAGVPYAIWISHRGHLRHGPRIWAYPDGVKDRRREIAIAIGEEPAVLRQLRAPRVPAGDLAQLVEWVRRNRAILLRYWHDNNMGTDMLLEGLRAISAKRTG